MSNWSPDNRLSAGAIWRRRLALSSTWLVALLGLLLLSALTPHMSRKLDDVEWVPVLFYSMNSGGATESLALDVLERIGVRIAMGGGVTLAVHVPSEDAERARIALSACEDLQNRLRFEQVGSIPPADKQWSITSLLDALRVLSGSTEATSEEASLLHTGLQGLPRELWQQGATTLRLYRLSCVPGGRTVSEIVITEDAPGQMSGGPPLLRITRVGGPEGLPQICYRGQVLR